MRFDIYIDMELIIIKKFMKEAYEYFGNRATEVGGHNSPLVLPHGLLNQSEIYLGAQTIVLESTLYQLNSLIDQIFLTIAQRLLPEKWQDTVKALSRSRTHLIKAIENEYKINIHSLPYWNIIEDIRNNANALKHRGGSFLPEKTVHDIPYYKRVQMNEKNLEKTTDHVKTFIMALWNETERSKETPNH